MDNAWQDVIKADLNDAQYMASGGEKRGPIPDGVYPAHVCGVEVKEFQSKAKGVQITYAITQEGDLKNREIKDYFVLVTKEGQGNRFGAARIKKLLLDCGLDETAILKFKFPDFGSKSFGDFKKILEQPLNIEVKQQEQKSGPQAGKFFARVVGFGPRAS